MPDAERGAEPWRSRTYSRPSGRNEADGSFSDDYCKMCYQDGAYTYETDLDNMIEGCAPYLMKAMGMSRDDAVSLMGAMLPNLKRWKQA